MSFSNRTVDFRYLLYTKEGTFLKEIKSVKSGNVQYSSLSRLKNSATIEIEDYGDINFLKDQIQIEVVIDGIVTPIGRYLISSPRRSLNGMNPIRTCDCFSRLVILDWDKCKVRYVVPAGTNIIAEVKRILQRYGGYNIPESNKLTSVAREWEIGTPYLDIVNNLLDTALYTSLYTDGIGTFVSNPYTLPADRNIQVTYKDDEASIIWKEMEDEIDLFGVPNSFIRYTNNPDISPPLVAYYENRSSDSPISIDNLGYEIVDSEEVVDVSNQTDLNTICKRDAIEKSDKYMHIEFKTAINPVHGYLTCIYFDCYDIEEKMIETSWGIECRAGGAMTHIARKAVNI